MTVTTRRSTVLTSKTFSLDIKDLINRNALCRQESELSGFISICNVRLVRQKQKHIMKQSYETEQSTKSPRAALCIGSTSSRFQQVIPIKKKKISARAKLDTVRRKARVPMLGLQNLDIFPQQEPIWRGLGWQVIHNDTSKAATSKIMHKVPRVYASS